VSHEVKALCSADAVGFLKAHLWLLAESESMRSDLDFFRDHDSEAMKLPFELKRRESA
jgi:hypothetical protein